MPIHNVEYESPKSLSYLGVNINALRIELVARIHNPNNRRSTAAFLDVGLCYFEPQLLYEVAVKLCQCVVYFGNDSEFKQHRQNVVASLVSTLREDGAVQEDLLRSPNHYCGKFWLCLGRGCADPTYMDLWLVPLKPAFFWGQEHPGVADASEVLLRRRLTGLADLKWVSALNGQRGPQ